MKKHHRQSIYSKFGGRCAYCGCELPKNWHADHVEPIVRNKDTNDCQRPENENIDNYYPACPSCNIQKNSFTVEQFRDNIQNFVNSLNQYSTQYKFAKKYGLIEETQKKVRFFFEP